MKIQQIQAQVQKRIKRIDSIQRAIERTLVLTSERIINGIDFDAGLQESIVILNGLEDALANAGLLKIVDDIDDLYADELENIIGAFNLINVSDVFSGVDADIIDAVIQVDLDRVGREFSRHVGDLRQSLTLNILTGTTPDIDDVVGKLSARTARNIFTEIDTALAGFNRGLTVKKTIDLFGDNATMIYLGPVDSKKRDFCRSIVNRKFKINEIRKMDNGQGLPVLQYGGGWGCRDQWRPVREGK